MRFIVALALLLVSACGRDVAPVAIAPDELPFDVRRGAQSTETPGQSQRVEIFLVSEGRLVGLSRSVPREVPAAEAALRALIEGPTAAEGRQGVATSLPDAVRLLGVSISENIAQVNLSGEFQAPATPEEIAIRVAQVVWTLTELPDAGSVAFSIDGEPAAVTTVSGETVSRPVTRTDYRKVGPRS